MKKPSIKFKTLLVVAILTATAAFGGIIEFMPAFAAKRGFTLSPMSQKIVLIPGETYKGAITIASPATSEEPFHYMVKVAPYYTAAGADSKDDYGDADFTTISNQNAIVDWIKIDNPKGQVSANENVTVSFSVEVPEDAPAGGQYASLAIQEDPGENGQDDGQTAIREIRQMSHIIYAAVAGETVEKGAITENNMPSFLTASPLIATSMVKNEGNIHTDAQYTLQVWPLISDEEICTNEENVSESLVLPNTERYHTESCNLPMIGIFRAKQTVRIFGEESAIEKIVVVCPIWLLFLILFAIVAVIIWLTMRARGRKKPAPDEKEED